MISAIIFNSLNFLVKIFYYFLINYVRITYLIFDENMITNTIIARKDICTAGTGGIAGACPLDAVASDQPGGKLVGAA